MANRKRPAPPPEPDPALPTLGQLSLEVGDRVRFRRTAGRHWQEATVVRRERDGSVALRDEKGASRSIRHDLLEVFRMRNRVGRWEPVVETDWEQLSLFDLPPSAPQQRPARRRRTPDPAG